MILNWVHNEKEKVVKAEQKDWNIKVIEGEIR
jgi:hypothetical protein